MKKKIEINENPNLDFKDVKQIIDFAWMKLDNIQNLEAKGPLYKGIFDDRSEVIPLPLMETMTNPEYMYFTAKHILGIRLFPFQAVMLQELWNRPFPMLIASRGATKTSSLAIYSILRALLVQGSKIVICGAGFRQSKLVFDYCEKIWNESPILRDICGNIGSQGPKHSMDMFKMGIGTSTIIAVPIGNGEKIRGLRATDLLCLTKDTLIQTSNGLIEIGKYLDGNDKTILNIDHNLERPSKILMTAPTDVYKITTRNGFSFKCSDSHQVMTADGWKTAKDLTTKDRLPIDHNDYFPKRYIHKSDIKLDEYTAWIMGLLIAEGSNTSRYNISIKNTDINMINQIQEKLKYDWKLYIKEAYINKRGWKCKKSYTIQYNNAKLRQQLYDLGIDYTTSHFKTIPWSILQSPKPVVIEFLKGMFWGDGTLFNYFDRKKKSVGGAYYSVCEKLIDQLQVLLLKFGIYGNKCKRRSKISKKYQWALYIRGANAVKLNNLLQLDKWKDIFQDITFRERKPHIRKNGEKFVVSTNQGNKNKHLGSFDTEEECIKCFKDFWKTRREVFKVKSVVKLDEQEVLYDFHMPETHSFIGNGFIQHNCDEFASIPRDIFEVVMGGFNAVTATPFENMVNEAKRAKLLEMGRLEEAAAIEETPINKSIIAGTAYYQFNHFFEYYNKWKKIIQSKGNERALSELFTDGIPDGFNWRDFSIIRLPYDILPNGVMDKQNIAKARTSTHNTNFLIEYGAVFANDSNGFFKRSLVESCVVKEGHLHYFPSGVELFRPTIKGNPNAVYVYGVDPASEGDNFSITILELRETHRRIVYQWTTNKKKHRDILAKNLTNELDYYAYCTRKIRDLMRKFPCSLIAMDSQGGGYTILESLHDRDKMQMDEQPIWEIIVKDKEKPTDGMSGLHIVELISFASSDWTNQANHGMRKDFEDKALIFPFFDSIMLEEAGIVDNVNKQQYDTLEDCVLEIEELKNELASIVHTQTLTSGRDRWDTPEIKMAGNKKGRMRKDRYSSLLMANMVARTFQRTPAQVPYQGVGGFANQIGGRTGKNSGRGPDWYTSWVKQSRIYN